MQEHHEMRLREILSVLEDGARTAWEIASAITWDINAESWDQFPSAQKWFAIGETIAHLRYLEAESLIEMKEENRQIFYSMK